jgi:mannan endo-1,4-beta-mannosidase
MEPTIGLVRAFTSKPILITETGAKIGPDAASWISSLFAGAESTPGIIGVTWFNSNSVHGDYRLQRDPRALRKWRAEARAYLQRAAA